MAEPAPALDWGAVATQLAAARFESLDQPALTQWLVDCERLAGWLTARTAEATAALDAIVTAEATALAEQARRNLHEHHRRPLGDPLPVCDWTADVVAAAGRFSSLQAERRLELARDLTRRLPATLAELEAGRIGYVHALVISEALCNLPDGVVGPLDARLAPEGRDRTPAQLRRTANRLARAAEDELAAATARDRSQAEAERPPVPRRPGERNFDGGPERWLELVETAAGGAHILSGQLPADAAAVVNAMLDQLSDRTGSDDHRTISVRRADALVELARYGLAHPDRTLPAAQFRINVVTPARLLAECSGVVDEPPNFSASVDRVQAVLGRALAGEQAELPGGVPMSRGELARAACTAPWTVLITDPDTGALMDLRPASPAPTPKLRHYIQLRDGTCRFPSCNRRATRCDIHHVRERQHGGATVRANLIALCSRHHHAVHDAGWRVRGDPETGTLTFIDPGGRPYRSRPAELPGARAGAAAPGPLPRSPAFADTG